MPQSLSNVIVQIVFSTKDRQLFIDDRIAESLHAYLARIARDTKSECYRVGGVEDDVHLAIRLARTISQSELVEKLKSNSSKWIKGRGPSYSFFSWQRGYGCFSISRAHLDPLIAYISDQKEHHRTLDFKDEFHRVMGLHPMLV